MSQKKIAIYITNDVIRMCEVGKSGSNVLVNRAFETQTPYDSVEDGFIIDVERVAEAISMAFHEHRVKKAKIVFSIYSRKIATKEIELPFVSQTARIKEMIASNVEDYFPMSNMQDYLIRHHIMDRVETEGRKFYKVMVVAVQKEMIHSYYELGKALKMPVTTIDYQVNSLYSLMRKQVKQGIALMLQVDEDTTHVTIMNGQTQLFRRSIPHGRDALVQAFAVEHRMEEEEARTILHDGRLTEDYLTPEEYGELIRDYASAITRVVEFYTSKNPELVIESARMYGMGAQLAGFGEVLGRSLGIDVETILGLNGIVIQKRKNQTLTLEQLSPYLPNIGAMIQSLDFKPEEEEKQKKGVGFEVFYILMGVVALAQIGMFAYVQYQTVQMREQKGALEERIAALGMSQDLYRSYQDSQAYLDTLKAYETSTVNNNEALYSLILTLEKIMPESVGITSLNSQNGSISLSCVAAGKEPTALFLIALKKEPFISGVRISDIRDTYDEFDRTSSTFSVTFQIRLPEVTEETEEGEEVQP